MKWIFLLALVLIAGCATQTSIEADADIDQQQRDTQSQDELEITAEVDVDVSDGALTFRLTGENFYFEQNGVRNPDLVVKEGDLVRIEFESVGGFHDWVVDEFDAATSRVRPEDGVIVVEFVADQKGTFEYYCSVGQHRANGMKGKLIVE